MMQHQSAPRHKPSLSLSSMELVLSPSYASAANSSITASTASVSATASGSSGGGGGGGGLSSSRKKKNGNGAHDGDDANLSFHASPVGSTIPHLLSTDCDNDSDDDDEDYCNNNKGQETYMNQNPRHPTTGGGHYEEGFIASSTRSNSFTHRYGNNSGADREADDDNDQFQSMLLDQQRQADEPCLDDSVIYHHQHAGTNDTDSHYTYPTQTASLPPPSSSSALEDDVESSMSLLQTNEERSHHHHHHRTSTGKNLLSKFSRSADSSREQAWEVVPPITMMIDLDDNDEDLPWMLSQPGFGVVGTTGNHCVGYESSSGGEKVEGNGSSLLHHDGGPHSLTQQQSSMRTAPTHRRYPSSLSSASSQNSIRSILRNGISNSGSAESRETATTASGICGAAASTASNPAPLLSRPNNLCDRADGAAGIPAHSGLDHGRVGMREEAESLIPVESSTVRGRSVHVQDRHNQRDHRSASQSARKSKRNEDGQGALSVASARTGRDSHSHHHRRTVSFPAEPIANDSKSNNRKTAPRDLPRDGSKSPRSLPPPGSQYDPNLTPLLDMGSSRTRKKLPAHVVQSVSEISPRTADFLAHEPVAVTALCKIQDRERYGHLLGPSTSSGAPSTTAAAITATIPSSKSNWGCNTYPPPAASSQSPAKRLQASYQRKLLSEAANFDRRSVLDTKQENEGNAYLSPSSKIQVFGFSGANRRGRPSSIKSTRRRKRMSNVDLLSPVEEMGGNTTGSTTTLMATTPMARYSLPARHNKIGRQPSFASDGSNEIRKESTSVSPLTSELQKAADAVWRDAETSPSSASASASASASSRSSFTVVATQCQCVVS